MSGKFDANWMDGEDNEEFMKRLEANNASTHITDPDEEPLPVNDVVAPPAEPAPSVPAPGVPFTMPGLKPSPEDIVQKRIDDLVKQRAADRAERQKLVQGVQDADSSFMGNLFAALGGIGAGIRGGDVGNAIKQIKDINTSGANRALAEFDRQTEEERQGRADEANARNEGRLMKKDEREDALYNAQRAAAARENDPNSLESQYARNYFQKLVPNVDPKVLARMTSAQVRALSPSYEKMADREYKTKEFQQKVKQHEDDQKQKAEQFNRTESRIKSEGALNRASRERAAEAMGGQRGFNNDIALLNASRMPPDMRKQVIDTVDVKKNYQNLQDQYNNNPDIIGYLNGTISAQKFFGTEAGKKLLADENILFDKERLKSTGAAFSDQELDALASHKIRPDDTPDQFKAKLKSNMETLNRALGTLHDFGGSQGYDMSYLNPYLDKPSTAPARALPSNPNAPKKESENTDPSKGPTARFPIGSIATNKKTGKPQVMTATGFRDQ